MRACRCVRCGPRWTTEGVLAERDTDELAALLGGALGSAYVDQQPGWFVSGSSNAFRLGDQ